MKSRYFLGLLSTFSGVLLFATSLYFAGEPAVKMSPTKKNVIAGVSAIGGGVLSFGVGRRLLASREDEQTDDARRRTRHGGS